MQPYDDCTCGRKWGDLHCPHCGYATVRGVPSRTSEATLPNGELIENFVYCCRKCAQFFDTVARLNCTAPEPRRGRAKHVPAVADKVQPLDIEHLDPAAVAAMERGRKKLQE